MNSFYSAQFDFEFTRNQRTLRRSSNDARSQRALCLWLLLAIVVTLLHAGPVQAQVALDAGGKYQCAGSTILLVKGGQGKPQKTARMLKLQRKSISRLSSQLKKAKNKKLRLRLQTQLAAARALLISFQKCAAGELDVATFSVAVPLALGAHHACAITPAPAAEVYCWGKNDWGQLGNGSTGNSAIPVKVASLNKVVAVSAGENHSCAALASGKVYCWGANNFGQFGRAAPGSSAVPVEITPIQDAAAIYTGIDHSCVLTRSNGLRCFGRNDSGECGLGATSSWVAPSVPLGFDAGVARVEMGHYSTCVVTQGGALSCFGWNNSSQLGLALGSKVPTPTVVPEFSTAVAAAATGYRSSCVVRSTDAAIFCTGVNNLGQLGRATPSSSASFIPASGLPAGSIRLGFGRDSGYALSAAGALIAWGANDKGQLGNGQMISSSAAVSVLNLPAPVVHFAAKDLSACAVLQGGEVRCWGDNAFGQLGNAGTNPIGEALAVVVAGLRAAQ